MDKRENIKLTLVALSRMLDAITELQYKRLEAVWQELQSLGYDNPKLMEDISETLEKLKKIINRELRRYWEKLDRASSATCRLRTSQKPET
ncbi:MAG: hypothetical protein ACTSYM_09185 [Candidatus Baldrarchaeia archaeon]